MSRFLMLPVAPERVLAHLGASLAVAGALRGRGHEVVFAHGGELGDVIDDAGFEWQPVEEMSLDPSADRWFSSREELAALVDSSIRVIERVRPDAAVVDASMHGRIACEATGTPDLHLLHFLASADLRRPADVRREAARNLRRPRRALALAALRLGVNARRLVPSRFALTPAGYAVMEKAIGEVREDLGLAPAPGLFGGAWNGETVACTTAPFIDPVRALPPHWRYVGPIRWEGPVREPAPVRGDRPLVYVTQGSTGSARWLRRAVEELAAEPVDTAVATGGLCDPEELTAVAGNVRAERYLPGTAWLEAADAAVIHGGHLTTGDALRTGTPVAVLPAGADQWDAVTAVERLGVGVGLWPPPGRGGIRRAVRGLLAQGGYRERAEAVATRLNSDWDGAVNAAALAEELAARRSPRRLSPGSGTARWSGRPRYEPEYDSAVGHPEPGIRPIFLLSSGRSGSTVVQRILGTHSRIATVSEPWILLPLLLRGRFPGAPPGTLPRMMTEAIEDFSHSLPAGRHAYRQTVRDLALRLYSEAAGGAEATYFLDKSPSYSLLVDEIVRTFPEGKLVFLWRNPVSVMASTMRLTGVGPQASNIDLLLKSQIMLTNAYRRHRDRAVAVRFEDLVRGRLGWERVMDYLDLPFEEEMLERFSAAELPGRRGDPHRGRYPELSEEPLTTWRSTIDTPARRAWCKRYLRRIGRARLAVMGYDLDELIGEVDSSRTRSPARLGSDSTVLVRLGARRATRSGRRVARSRASRRLLRFFRRRTSGLSTGQS